MLSRMIILSIDSAVDGTHELATKRMAISSFSKQLIAKLTTRECDGIGALSKLLIHDE